MRTHEWLIGRVLLSALVALSLAACVGGRNSRGGGVDGGGSGSCPDIAGSWTINDHCESDAIGSSVTISQSGCSWTADFSGTLTTGTISSTGAVTGHVDVEEGLDCTGNLSGNRITQDCVPGDCHVVLSRDEAPPPRDAGGGGVDSGGGGTGPSGSACNCDSNCVGGSGSNPSVCVGGVCMIEAAGKCTEPGSPDGCPANHRCWPNGAGAQICWPDCSAFSCAGDCDADGSCVPNTSLSCDPACGSHCDSGGA